MIDLEYKRAVRLGNLYEFVQDVWDMPSGQARARLRKLADIYGYADVAFILEVVTEDRRNATEANNGFHGEEATQARAAFLSVTIRDNIPE